ncbi:MAG: AmmeMemoRadiSam system radical SAM enzyme [Marinilabiliaceae bacterium]|nr:AmmeMemoRadiSam system radical SAM enzyme [Marinilabiliaceae bacterium]
MNDQLNNDQSIHKALYYVKSADRVICKLCPHECKLSNYQVGKCKARKNIDGELYALNYGNLCAIHIDPVEKKPLYHFMPGSKTLSIATGGCNLTCLNCQNWQISQSSPQSVAMYQYSPDEVVNYAIKHQCRSISYTYTEPLIGYEFVLDTAKIASRKGLKNILVTAGYINEEPLQELLSYINAANVDLKNIDSEVVRQLCGIDNKHVLQTLRQINKSGVWLEITNLLIPGWTDNIADVEQMCDWLVDNGFVSVPLHFSRFVPGHELLDVVSTPTVVIHNAIQMALKKGISYVYSGNLMSDKYENTYCPECHEKLIVRDGYQITENRLKKDQCPYCNSMISGVWE